MHRLCTNGGLNPELERPGLLRPRPSQDTLPEDGSHHVDPAARRPADVYVPRWRAGVPAAFDFAVTSGMRSSCLQESAADGASAATAYEGKKCSHLDTKSACEAEGVSFLPMVADAAGGWAPTARFVWSELASFLAVASGESAQTACARVLQSVGLVLQKENARAILRRSEAPSGDCLESGASGP